MRRQSSNMISFEKTPFDHIIMPADGSGNTAFAPVSVEERIAALQGDKGRSSTCKPSTALKLPPPPMTKARRTNALANRIASQNTKTTDNDLFQGTISSYKTQINEMGFPSSVAASHDKTESNSSVLTPTTWKARESRSSVVSPTGTPKSKTPVSGNELKFCAALLTQSPQVVTERDCEGSELEAIEVAVIKLDDDDDVVKGNDNSAKQTENSFNESGTELPIFTYTVNSPTLQQDKLPAAKAVSKNDASISFDSLPKLPAAKAASKNDASISFDSLPKLPATNAASNHATISFDSLPKLPATNATSNNDASISFDSLPPEVLNSTWNLSPGQCRELIESFSSDDMFIVKASNSEVDRKCVTPKKLTEQLMPVTNEIKAVLAESRDKSHGLAVVKEELLPEDQPPKIQQMKKPSLVSKASAALRSKRAAKQGKVNLVSPTGVDRFRTEEEAQINFRLEGAQNETVISYISVSTPAETIQSNYTRIFGDDPLDEQQRNNLQVDNSFVVQNEEDGCFNAKQLITKSIASREILIGVIESSLGVLADTVAEGYDLVASSSSRSVIR